MKRRFANWVNKGKNKYLQKRIDEDYFKGYVCLAKIKNVEEPWIIHDDDFTGCILDEDYEWLEIYPDNAQYAITVMFDDKKNLVEWYFDTIKRSGIENDIPYIDDLYLDLVIRRNGNQIVLDEDELKEALETKDITKEDFEMAHKTVNELKEKYTNNLDELLELTNKLYDKFKNDSEKNS